MKHLIPTKVTLFIADGPDYVYIDIRGISPYPGYMPGAIPSLRLEVSKGFGAQWIKETFGDIEYNTIGVT